MSIVSNPAPARTTSLSRRPAEKTAAPTCVPRTTTTSGSERATAAASSSPASAGLYSTSKASERSSLMPTSSNLSATRTFIAGASARRLPEEHRDRQAVERLVARLRHDHVAHLEVRVLVDPVGHLVAQPLAVRDHGRREHLHPVELAVLPEGGLPDADVRTHVVPLSSHLWVLLDDLRHLVVGEHAVAAL